MFFYGRARCWCRSWLRHYATSWKVAGSIPDGIIGIFHWHIPSGRTVVLGSTQPPTEMSTRNISWGIKAAGVWSWQPYHHHVPTVLKSVSLNLLEPSGPVQACNGIKHSLLSSDGECSLVQWNTYPLFLYVPFSHRCCIFLPIMKNHAHKQCVTWASNFLC